jgi:ABC-type phosphate/phosphonate transport system ATPase subunit
MKTPEEILRESDLVIYPNQLEHIVKAMEEYDNQSKWIDVNTELPKHEQDIIITNGEVVESAQYYAGRKKGIETKRVLFTMPASKVKELKPIIKKLIKNYKSETK